MYKKIWIWTMVGILTISSALGIGLGIGLHSSLNNSQNILNELNDPSYNNKDNFIFAPESDYNEAVDALNYDAKEKAQSDSIIFYYIGWKAIFHRFGFLIHLITILKHNPNKQIHIYSDKDTFDLSFLEKYPNIHLNEIVNENQTLENIRKSLIIDQDFINDINTYSKEKKIDLYIDDKTIFESINTIFSTQYLEKEDFEIIINQFGSTLYKTETINLFSDGTHSTSFYSTWFYNWLGKSNNAYELSSKMYVNNEKYYLYFKQNNSPKIDNFVDLLYFMISPLISSVKSNDFIRSKYFHTSTQAIIDANYNQQDNRILIKNSQKTFFDPYNSLNSGTIQAIANFNEEQRKQLLIGLKVSGTLDRNDPEFNFMDNALNLVYSGRLLADLNSQDLNNECKKIISFYTESKNKYPNKKIQIIFKGHPRDDDENTILSLLKFEISNILFLKPEEIDWLFTINRKIPFELYLAFNIFFDYPSKSREVLIYVGYSTIAAMTYDYNKSINIESFLLSQKENNDINYFYGPNSKLFPQNKRVVS